MNNDKHRWMKWLTDPIKREDQKVKNVGVTDDGYCLSIYPMCTFVDNQPWTFASNGAASLLVRDQTDWRSPTENQAAMIEGLIRHEIKGKLFALSQFKRWLGRGWDGKLPCSCHGDWAKNCASCFGIGRKQTRCTSCPDVHDCACKRCDGDGVLYCPACTTGSAFEKKPGHYRGTVFDRTLLARFLSYAECEPTTRVRIMAVGKTHPVWVEHENGLWRAVIMPLREPESVVVSEWTGA